MARITLAAVCTILCACGATQPPKPDAVPKELIPAGFSAADCKVTDPGGPITDNSGPNGTPRQVGIRPPRVACTKHDGSPVTLTTKPTCHTVGGKTLPLADCCM